MSLIERYSTTNNGAMLFTGNTLGLGGLDDTGVVGDIRAFITLDTTQQVPGYPPGTTLIWQNNSSSAVLTFPVGSTILYAELQWGGTEFAVGGQDVSSYINNPITFYTPSGNYIISPDLTATQEYTTPAGNKFYSQGNDVTAIVKAAGIGTYSVGGVPATISNNDNRNNSAAWTLGIIYYNPTLPVRNMTMFLGLQGIATPTVGTPVTADIPISGFLAPAIGPVKARILISAIEGDPGITGDQVLFGPNTGSLVNLLGPNNLSNNFFASQINNASSVSPSVGLIDTTGTFGTLNPTPGSNPPQGTRYGSDITNVAATNFVNNQTSGVVRLYTVQDAYGVVLLGTQLDAVGFDFGDAPDTSSGNAQGNYSTLLANNGPRHGLVNNLKLGTQVTFEDDAYQNTDADGDDINKGIQDDGLISTRIIAVPSATYTITVQYTNDIGSNANIYAWIDFNKDGIFQLEEAGTVVSVPSSISNPRSVSINFTVPATSNLTPGDITYLRIRITSNNLINTNILPTQEDTRSLGVATDGEVEDYLLNVYGIDFGDAPDTSPGNGPNNYSTLLANNGPRHVVIDWLTLGTKITSEADAYQNPTATGDDLIKGVQDDALNVPVNSIILGENTYEIKATVVNNTGKTAYIYAWVDFNKDGIFELEEASPLIVVPSISTAPQVINITFDVPSSSTLLEGDNTFIRLRLTTEALNNTNIALTAEDTRSLGQAQDGEVEDYIVGVVAFKVQGVVWYDTNCNGIRENGEPLVQGVLVKLFNINDTVNPVAVTNTDINGLYPFNNVPSGNYYVVVELPSGYNSFTLPNVGINDTVDSDVNSSTGISEVFSLSESNQIQIVDAGLCKCFIISGKSFFDCSSNGILNSMDTKLCGVKVYLVNNIGDTIQSEITDCDGNYEFNCIKPGNYQVQFVAPPSMNYTLQNTSYFGSKIDSTTGIADVTVSNLDVLNIFGGFTGSYKLKSKYCNSNVCN